MATIVQAVSTQVFANRCGDNLLNNNLTFNQPFSATIVSGTGLANTSTDVIFAGNRSLYVNNLATTTPLVISGGTSWYNDFTGSYILGTQSVFQFSVYNSMGSGTTATGRFRVFFSSLEVYTVEFTTTTYSAWETFFITLPFYQNYDFTFELDNDPAELEATEIYLDGIKLEIDDKRSNIPTPYTTYVPKVLDLVETIDVPSISSGASYVASVTFTGAEVGDNVELVAYPNELIDMELIVCKPIVYSADLIKFVIHNPSGGAHNPASGDYTFKIVK